MAIIKGITKYKLANECSDEIETPATKTMPIQTTANKILDMQKRRNGLFFTINFINL